MFELSLAGPVGGNPFVEVELRAQFQKPNLQHLLLHLLKLQPKYIKNLIRI